MDLKNFQQQFSGHFRFPLTQDQAGAVRLMYDFLFTGGPQAVFVLKGYAGTGKTTLVAALVSWLNSVNRKSLLLAPTGRAAKVLGNYSGRPSSTIHRQIYKVGANKNGSMFITLNRNIHSRTFFIVDEASMISNASGEDGFGGRNLLDDLVQFVGDGELCRLIFIGDTAQLPPVGLDMSPALQPEYLKSRYGHNVFTYELKEVVRQARDSNILENATAFREQLARNEYMPRIRTDEEKEIMAISGGLIEDALVEGYARYGEDDTVVICRSNRDANQFNKQVRARILWRENEVESGDRLMVVRNNYFWTAQHDLPDFLANGEIVKVERVIGYEDVDDFRFADVELSFPDKPEFPNMEVKVFLEVLDVDTAAMGQGRSKKLYALIREQYEKGPPPERPWKEEVKKNPYLNALQVKYGYAVTCHKAQGGQWKAVFVHQGYITEELVDRNYLRWLYTAFTRATERLFLVNFHPQFFEDPEMAQI